MLQKFQNTNLSRLAIEAGLVEVYPFGTQNNIDPML